MFTKADDRLGTALCRMSTIHTLCAQTTLLIRHSREKLKSHNHYTKVLIFLCNDTHIRY